MNLELLEKRDGQADRHLILNDINWQQYCLQEGTYIASEKSQFLPDLDLNILANFVQPDNQPTAVREFFKSLH